MANFALISLLRVFSQLTLRLGPARNSGNPDYWAPPGKTRLQEARRAIFSTGLGVYPSAVMSSFLYLLVLLTLIFRGNPLLISRNLAVYDKQYMIKYLQLSRAGWRELPP